MLNLKNLMCAALAATLFFSASEAEARFGKSSSSSDSDKKEEKKETKHEERNNSSSSRAVHDASPVRVHDASPVGSSRPNPPPPERYEHHERHDRVIVVEPEPTYYVEPEPSYYVEPEPSTYVEPPPSTYVGPPPSSPPAEIIGRKSTLYSAMRMGVEGGFVAGGGSRGTAFLAIEGEQMGVDGRISGLTLPTDDGSAGTDEIGVAEVHLTWAAIAQERMRLRMEAGFSYAGAPDLKVYAPSLGVSFDGRLAPGLDFEARVQVTPFPYHQVDSQAALALKLYPFALRGGWRTLFMDDAGLVDGESHADLFNGPYVGLGLNF